MQHRPILVIFLFVLACAHSQARAASWSFVSPALLVLKSNIPDSLDHLHNPSNQPTGVREWHQGERSGATKVPVLYYYPKPRRGETRVVVTYPVSIGRMDWHSPLGQTWIIAKERHPSWYPPESIRKEHAARGDPLPKVVPPGAKNPLGDYKMRLAVGDGTYEIHGTNNPVAVGLAVTHGWPGPDG
jgi:lipoprotein-anchoring transpeptidase ErfK/SrfK